MGLFADDPGHLLLLLSPSFLYGVLDFTPLYYSPFLSFLIPTQLSFNQGFQVMLGNKCHPFKILMLS